MIFCPAVKNYNGLFEVALFILQVNETMLITCTPKIEGCDHTTLEGNLILRSTTHSEADNPSLLFIACFVWEMFNEIRLHSTSHSSGKSNTNLGQCQNKSGHSNLLENVVFE